MSPNVGGGGVAGSQPMRTAVHTSSDIGAQINFGDLTPYLTYAPHLFFSRELVPLISSHPAQSIVAKIFTSEPVLLNVYGAPELIPRNEFRQPM
jgi:hypothetical protein